MVSFFRVILLPAVAGLSLVGCGSGSAEAVDGLVPDGSDSAVNSGMTASSPQADCLPGNWILDNTSLAVAMDRSIRRGVNGTDFRLDSIKGDYLAKIDPAESQVVVTWDDWVMEGTATTKNGTFPVRLRLDGRQEYAVADLTDTTMAVGLTREAVNATVSFAGMNVTDPMIDIPPFSGGEWSCQANALNLNSEGNTWNFERADY